MIPIKSEKEIEKMRESCRAASETLERLAGMVCPGVSTGEIDQAAAEYFAAAGGRSAFLGYRGFPGQICISVNEEVVHGIGGPRRIQYGDIVKLDVGIVLAGWVGDTATTVAVGLVDEKTQHLLRVTKGALTKAIEFAHEGSRLGDISSSVEQEVTAHGYTVVREFVGHGVGRKLHEEPQIPNYGRRGSGPKLKAGMVLAIEPMVNMGTSKVKILGDGWTVVTADRMPSAHFEHTVLITKAEPEILTWREKTLSK